MFLNCQIQLKCIPVKSYQIKQKQCEFRGNAKKILKMMLSPSCAPAFFAHNNIPMTVTVRSNFN